MHNTCRMISLLFALLVYHKAILAQQKKCVVLEPPHLKDNIIGVSENDYVNLTFWLNVSGCNQSNTTYRMTVKIKTNTGLLEEAGRIAVTNGTCAVTAVESLHCVSPAGPAQLYRKVTRSHVEIEWKWRWKDEEFFISENMTVTLNISYLPSVTNLTLEAQEIKGHYIINEGQQVIIVCSFDKGNPPATFRLLDKNGRELDDVIRAERELVHSLPAGQCEQPWPVVRCEAHGSSENRSVTFLVRCPPQFTDMPRKQIYPDVYDNLTFNIKAHTTVLVGCLLTPESLTENSSREVTCSLIGKPPDLFLTLQLQKKDRAMRGNWTLTVSNEIGAGKTTVIFTPDYYEASESFVAGYGITVYIVISLCSVVIIAIMFFLAIYGIRKKKYGNSKYESQVCGSARDAGRTTFQNMKKMIALTKTKQ